MTQTPPEDGDPGAEGPRAASIRAAVADALEPTYVELVNESHMHAGGPNRETHFKLVVVSERFAGQPRLARHRRVHALCKEALASGVHALSISAYTPDEWAARGESARDSPNCRGG